MVLDVKRIPSYPGSLPLLGHALAFNRDPFDFIVQGRERMGDVFRFRFLGKDVYALLSQSAIDAVFRAPDDQLGQREAYRITVPIFGRGVIYDVEPEIMLEQMKLVYPALRNEALEHYVQSFADETSLALTKAGPCGTLDVFAYMRDLTLRIADHCLVGTGLRDRLSDSLTSIYADLEGGLNRIALFAPSAPTPANTRRNHARRRIGDAIKEVMRERRAGSTIQKEGGKDFLSVLMQARDGHGNPLPEETIVGLVVALLFVGNHTTAVTGAWLGLLLAQHPQTVARLRDEAANVLNAGPVTLSAMKRLTYMDAVLKEVERLYPFTTCLMRTVYRPLDFDGYRIPAGALAMISPAVSHRSRDIYTRPNAFDPDRFLPPREEDKAVPWPLFGFGGGRHTCIGRAFALLELKVVWTVILQKLDIELACPGQLPKIDRATLLSGPTAPREIRYRPRAVATSPVQALAS